MGSGGSQDFQKERLPPEFLDIYKGLFCKCEVDQGDYKFEPIEIFQQ